MVSQMSMESYNSRFFHLFSQFTCLVLEWGENLILGYDMPLFGMFYLKREKCKNF